MRYRVLRKRCPSAAKGNFRSDKPARWWIRRKSNERSPSYSELLIPRQASRKDLALVMVLVMDSVEVLGLTPELMLGEVLSQVLFRRQASHQQLVLLQGLCPELC